MVNACLKSLIHNPFYKRQFYGPGFGYFNETSVASHPCTFVMIRSNASAILLCLYISGF